MSSGRSRATPCRSLLAQAQADGALRADLTVDDLYLLVSTAPYHLDEHARARWLDLVVPALRSPSTRQRSRPVRRSS